MTTKDTLNKILSNQEAILAALGSGAGASGSSDNKAVQAILADVQTDLAYLVADTKESSATTVSATPVRVGTVQSPVITGLSPAGGSAVGGDTVTLSGTGFTGATEVTFGNTSVTPTVLSDTSATVVTPAGVAGSVNVTIKNAVGVSATAPFTVA